MTGARESSGAGAGHSSGPLYGLLAEFQDVDSVIRAARAVRDAGYTRFDVHSPFPVHGIDGAMGIRPTKLPWIVLGCGLLGTGLALLGQWWMNAVDYPFKISAKPFFGIPANIPITFEFTVLLAAFAAFFGMLALNRLPLHHHPLFEVERFKRATDDRFFVSIEARDAKFDAVRTAELLGSLGSAEVIRCPRGRPSTRSPALLKAALWGVAALALLPLARIVHERFVDHEEPALHLVPDMDYQAKFRAQSANDLFADGRAMRPDPVGTVSFDDELYEPAFETGKDGENYLQVLPLPWSEELVARGQQRFGIYCAACHGEAGYGDGMVARRAADLLEPNWVPPSSLHDALIRERSVGQLFEVIRQGVRTMPAYGEQMSVDDSWAIVAYVRALQRSQNAVLDDVPAAQRGEIEP